MAPKPTQAPVEAMASPPAPVTHEGRGKLEQRARQAAVGGKLAHEHEQRNHRQVVVGQAGVGQVVQREQQAGAVATIHGHKAHGTADQHAHAHVNAQCQQKQQARKNPQSNGHAAHRVPPSAVCSDVCVRYSPASVNSTKLGTISTTGCHMGISSKVDTSMFSCVSSTYRQVRQVSTAATSVNRVCATNGASNKSCATRVWP